MLQLTLMSNKRAFLIRFLEFFVIGVVFGLGEDLVAIRFATDSAINTRTVLLTLIVAFPFAVFTELVVDHPDFWDRFFKNNDKIK